MEFLASKLFSDFRSMSKLRTVICLFRNDLRLHDNEALVTAHKLGDLVVPLYCFDPAHYKGTWHFNFAKTGPHRAQFLVDSALDLRSSLRKQGSDLVVHHSSPAAAIENIHKFCQTKGHFLTDIVYQKEVTFEEVKTEEDIDLFCKRNNIKVNKIWGATLYHIQGIYFVLQPT